MDAQPGTEAQHSASREATCGAARTEDPLLFTLGCNVQDATPRSWRNCTTSELAFCVHMQPTMNNTKKTEKPVQIPTIDTIKLDAVTGGCAACGNPKHKREQQAE